MTDGPVADGPVVDGPGVDGPGADEARDGGWAAYRNVFRVPGSAAFCGAGTVSRLGQAMQGLGALLAVAGLDRSFALAGLLSAAIAVAQGLTGPLVGRLIDGFGQFRVMLPQLVLHALAGSSLIAALLSGSPGWALVVLSVATGATLPQVGAMSRARWSHLLPQGRTLTTAMTVEGLVDEAVFVVGPLLVTALATLVAPAAGLLVAVLLCAIGGLSFAVQRGTEPAPPDEGMSRTGGSAIRSGGLRVVVGVFLFIGAVFGLVEVGVVAFTREQSEPGVAGLVLGLWAAGSVVAGAFYGGRTWASSARRRFVLSLGGFAAGSVLVAAAALPGSVLVLTLAMIVAGNANAPSLITGNTLVPAVVPQRVVTEAYSWLNVTILAGVAAGSALGGLLIDRSGASAALLAIAPAAALALLVGWTGRSRLVAEAAA